MKESTAKPSSGQGRSSEVARALIRRTKQASRRRFPAEEKIRILLEGIHPTVYYTWMKDFMEAGKARMRGDSLRDATTVEVRDLRGENERLKQLVADLSLTNLTLKKSLR